jgi:hypothetical protein
LAIEGAVVAVDLQTDAIVVRDNRFEREPPQHAEPVGKTRRHIDGERHTRLFEDRIGVLLDVAIAVVEGEADEAPLEIALRHAAVHLVEADEVDVGAAQKLDHAGEEARRDLEQAIGLEAVRPRRADVMKRQNDADPADQRFQGGVRAAEIERLQSAADDRLPEPGHCWFLGLRRSYSTLG